MSQASATAHYASPNGTQAFSQDLPPLTAGNVEEKTTYLNTLRSKNTELQGEINAFLTQKMEEDVKITEGGKGQSGGKKSRKEEREEEMYGEEDPEADG